MALNFNSNLYWHWTDLRHFFLPAPPIISHQSENIFHFIIS